jgi:Xaa-Pro aminopeptidase
MSRLPRPTRETHQARIAGLLESAGAAGCAGLLLVDALNQYWASGYNVDRDASNWERPCALLLPLSGKPVFVLNEICAPHARLAVELGWCWVEEMHFYLEHPPVQPGLPTIHDWSRLVRSVLAARDLEGKRLACDNPTFCRHWLGRDADAVDLLDASRWVRRTRMIKDEVEIATLRAAAALTDEAMADLRASIRPGAVAMEIAWAVQTRLFTAAAQRYPDARVEGKVLAFTGLDTACVNAPYGFAGRRIVAGDSVITVIILSLNGYSAENERTFLVGQDSAEKRAYFEVAVEAQAAGRAAGVAGNAIRDIDAAALAVIERAGMGQFVHHRTGHGIGLSGHEPPGDMAFNDERLEPGMLFTVEPGIYVPGIGGFRHSDTILIGDHPESLTRFGRGLDDCTIAG